MKKFYTLALAAAVAFGASAYELQQRTPGVTLTREAKAVNLGEALTTKKNARKAPALAPALTSILGDYICSYFCPLGEGSNESDLVSFEQSDDNQIAIYGFLSDIPVIADYDAATGVVSIATQSGGKIQESSGGIYDLVIGICDENYEYTQESFEITFGDDGSITASDNLIICFDAFLNNEYQGSFNAVALPTFVKDEWVSVGTATLVDGLWGPLFGVEEAPTSEVEVMASVGQPGLYRILDAWRGTYTAMGITLDDNEVTPSLEIYLGDPNFVIIPLQPVGIRENTMGATYLISTNWAFADNLEELEQIGYGEYNTTLTGNVVNIPIQGTGCIFANNTEKFYATPLASTITLPEGWSDANGVEDVVAGSDAPVEFYNLQGIRVANPTNGIFIRRQGNQTTKVYKK